MSINFDKLKDMTPEAIRTLAIQQGLSPHPRAKVATIAKQIIEKVTQPIKQELKHPAQLPPKREAKSNTEAEVREACQAFFAKPGFEAIFEGETWHFKYKGTEDTGHMSVPLRVIALKARTVSQGARRLYLKRDVPVSGPAEANYFSDKVMMI
jgi:hypothetical protein